MGFGSPEARGLWGLGSNGASGPKGPISEGYPKGPVLHVRHAQHLRHMGITPGNRGALYVFLFQFFLKLPKSKKIKICIPR